MKLSCLRLPDRIRLRQTYDAARMAAEVDSLVGDWLKHFVTQNYDGDWSVIPLRGPKGATHPVMMMYSDPSCEEFEDTPFLKRCAYLREVLEGFKLPLQCVRLMRLGVGSRIKEHSDHDLEFEQGSVRLHIPITTSEDVKFLLNGSEVRMEAGSCWYLRLSDRHEVFNGGNADRIHLVIDGQVNSWLEDELRYGAATADGL